MKNKILLTPDSFKDSISADKLCKTLAKILIDYTLLLNPIADGGENTLSVLKSVNPSLISVSILAQDPLGRLTSTIYLIDPSLKIAYIELSQTAGLERLKHSERNCMFTSSYGAGQQILDAYRNNDCQTICLFLGSSATNDGGMGIAQALGFKFHDVDGKLIARMEGQSLEKIELIIPPLESNDIRLIVACDVKNKLYGKSGAAFTYARQKGASPEEILILDQNLMKLSMLINKQFNINIADLEGGGAAGGIAAGMFGLFNAELKSGFEIISELTGLERKIASCDLVITGEGRIDQQSKNGKVIQPLCKLAQKHGKKVYAICGENQLSPKDFQDLGISEILMLNDYNNSGKIDEKSTEKLLLNMTELINTQVKQLVHA